MTTRTAIPTIDFCGQRIPRMIVGCNQIGGYSHNVRCLSQAMVDYFTLENTVAHLRRCEQAGLNVWLGYHTGVGGAALRALWAEGSSIRPYFLGALDESGQIDRSVLDFRPLWYVHHGNRTDDLFAEGRHHRVHDFVKRVHDELHLPAGVSCHNPDCIRYMEDHGWEVDFYQLCSYYLTRPQEEVRQRLGGAMLTESFLDTDRDRALALVRQVRKPCLVFKILAAGWHCESDETVEAAFRAALTGIKPTDGIIVGMWPKFKDELSQNLSLLCKYGQVA